MTANPLITATWMQDVVSMAAVKAGIVIPAAQFPRFCWFLVEAVNVAQAAAIERSDLRGALADAITIAKQAEADRLRDARTLEQLRAWAAPQPLDGNMAMIEHVKRVVRDILEGAK